VAFLQARLGYRPTGAAQPCHYHIEPRKGMFTLEAYLAGRNATAFTAARR